MLCLIYGTSWHLICWHEESVSVLFGNGAWTCMFNTSAALGLFYSVPYPQILDYACSLCCVLKTSRWCPIWWSKPHDNHVLAKTKTDGMTGSF